MTQVTPKIMVILPKMPHKMTDVYHQIKEHSNYSDLDQSTIFMLGLSESGLSWCTTQNNLSTRDIWSHLYHGTKINEYIEKKEEEKRQKKEAKYRTKTPKMPHYIYKVIEDIKKHPEYVELTENYKDFVNGGGGGGTYDDGINAIIRDIWKYLYLKIPFNYYGQHRDAGTKTYVFNDDIDEDDDVNDDNYDEDLYKGEEENTC